MSATVQINSDDAIPANAKPGFQWNNRYKRGEQYVFIAQVFDGGSVAAFPPYLPWGHTNMEMKFIKLRCVERHVVPEHWSRDHNCTGFIFQDDKGLEWYNQYPDAHYGQLDDSNDRRVYLADKHWERDDPFNGTRFSVNAALASRFEDAFTFLERIERGLVIDAKLARGEVVEVSFNIKLTGRQMTDDQAAMLRKYKEGVEEEVGKLLGGKIGYKPLTVNRTDGRVTVLENHPKAYLVK